MTEVVKRAYRYRFYPTDVQAAQLSRTLGCVRLVYNKALDARTRAYANQRRRITYGQTSAMLTEWKKTTELAFLGEVSCVPLQHALRHLQAAFAAFFDKRAKYPRFKSEKRSRASAEYTRSAFHWRDGQLTLAKMADPLAIVWSRPLPDGADLSVCNLMRNHCLARAISDAAWSQLRTMLEYKTRWYGRKLVVVDRWLPSSKLCSTCGRLAELMPLGVREWACACGARHDRDVNAALNILAAGLADSNARGGPVRPQPRKRGRRGPVKQELSQATAGIPVL